MTAPGIERRLKALRARGGRLVVVDPRRTETAALADLHVAIRPGTDALLLLALLHVLQADGLMKPGRLGGVVDGLEEVAAAARPYPPERVAAATGIEAGVIRRLARDFAASPRAVAYGRVGVSTQEFGGLAAWLLVVLNIATGNLDREGGAMFPSPAVDIHALADRLGVRGSFGRWRTRCRGLPEFGGEAPVASLAEEIEAPGRGQIRGLVTLAGNPVLSSPNGARLDRALAGLDFMLSVDFFVNETTRHAHLILPPTSPLEHDHFDIVFHALAVRNTVRYSPPLFDAPADARHDWQALLELSERLARAKGRHGLRSRLSHAALRRLGPRGLLRVLLRMGPTHLSLGRVEAALHGIDLGPLVPRLPEALRTPGRRVRLAPPPYLADLRRLGERLPALAASDGLVLIGRRDLRSNNSWMHNCEGLVKGRERCTLLMHPDDAVARGLADGQRVQVRSRAGSVQAPLRLTDAMRPGVVSLPHGWGHGRDAVRLRVAAAHAGVSSNDVTDEQAVDALSGTAVLSGVAVEVTASA
jgi:anaerobic selenocysteine-containing dehydrogenase